MLADDLKDALAVWLTADFEVFLEAIGEMFVEVEMLVGDFSEDGGYPTLLDVDLARTQDLPWLAQIVGERLPVGITDPAAREWIKDHPKQRRGTERSIFLAAQRTLTGTRLVSLRTRTKLDGSPDVDYITVRTITSQTPDPTVVYKDLRKNVVPADIVLDYTTIVGETWQDVRELGGASIYTWQEVKDDFVDWHEVLTTLSGDTVFTRPPPV